MRLHPKTVCAMPTRFAKFETTGFCHPPLRKPCQHHFLVPPMGFASLRGSTICIYCKLHRQILPAQGSTVLIRRLRKLVLGRLLSCSLRCFCRLPSLRLLKVPLNKHESASDHFSLHTTNRQKNPNKMSFRKEQLKLRMEQIPCFSRPRANSAVLEWLRRDPTLNQQILQRQQSEACREAAYKSIV